MPAPSHTSTHSPTHGLTHTILHSATGGGGSNTTLSLSITDSADPVISDQPYAYTVQVNNTGSNAATSVTVTIVLDTSVSYVSSSGTGWTISTASLPTITATMASMAVGAANPITVNVTAGTAAGTRSTTARVSASNAPTVGPTAQTTTVNFVTKDAAAGIYAPASATEWTNFIAAKGLSVSSPSSLWNCSEASGNLADSIGSLALTASGTPLYTQAATGWTRTGVSFTDASAGRFGAAAGAGPNPTATSSTWLIFSVLPAAPAVNRVLMGVSGNSSGNMLGQLLTTNKPRITVVGVTTDGTSSPASASHPLVLKYNRTGSEAKFFTKDEKVTGTYSALLLDGTKGIGAVANTSAAQVVVYACMWSGAAGEMTDANLKALLQAMGWTISWT